MNKKLQEYARSEIKNGLQQCTEAQVGMFRRMYSHNDIDRDLNEIIDTIPKENLSRVMDQINRTIAKNGA